MEKERSYAKESRKSTPTGIRFNLKLEQIALTKSRLRTRQQLVDFLLENYVNGEHPTLERQIHTTVPHYPTSLTFELESEPEKRKKVAEWIQEKREIPDGNMEMYRQFLSRLDKATYLTEREKVQVRQA